MMKLTDVLSRMPKQLTGSVLILPGFVRRHLQALGITRIEDCGEDTYAATSGEITMFFSHRRATHAKAHRFRTPDFHHRTAKSGCAG